MRLAFVGLCVVGLSACGSSASSSDPAAAPAAPTPAPGNSADGGPAGGDAGRAASNAAPPCVGRRSQPLDQVRTLTSGGVDRTARVHVPASYDPTVPTALVLDFHAFGSDASTQDLYAGMSAKADASGFIAVHPQGIANSWNAGACCGQAQQQGTDDVGFVGKLLDELEIDLCVDSRRVFATGMSNGAFFSQRLGCELAERIAAIAPVAGVLGVPTCAPARPVAILEIHGTLDTLVPYGGSSTLGFPSVADTFAGWVKRDGCSGQPIETFRDHDAHCSGYASCSAGSSAVLCVVDGGGHVWPGSIPTVGVYTSAYLHTTDAIWSFFLAHPKP